MENDNTDAAHSAHSGSFQALVAHFFPGLDCLPIHEPDFHHTMEASQNKKQQGDTNMSLVDTLAHVHDHSDPTGRLDLAVHMVWCTNPKHTAHKMKNSEKEET